MADEPTQAPAEDAQDTPTPDATDTPTEAPEQTDTDAQTQAEIDYEKRYQDLQPEYTRATQEAAQYRQIIELAQQGDPEALELLGLEAAQDTEDEDPPDSDERLDRIEQMFQQQQEQAEAQQAQEAFLVDVNDGIEAIEEKTGRTLSDAETQFVLAQTEAQLRSGQQMDVEAAFAPIEDMSKAAIDRYVKSKKTAQVPPLGSAGEDKIDLSDDDARQEYLAQVMQAESQREA